MIMTIYFGRQFGTTEPRASIRLDPEIWLREKGTLGNLRKLLKLSAESDRHFDTFTLKLWEEAAEYEMIAAKANEPIELAGAASDHEGRLYAAEEWRRYRLQKEDERFRNAKIHRGKSHAQRVREIEERYIRMIADEKKRYAAEQERIRRHFARARALAIEQMEAVRKYMQEVMT